MKFKSITLLTIASFAITLNGKAQVDENTREGMARMSCTSIMVGKKASTDGSVITSHTCDSWYRTWMQMMPAKDYPKGSQVPIFSERMHTQTPQDSTGMKVRGYIPQVDHTYRFLDVAYPCLNEKQVGIGETTISGRDTLRNKNGLFMIEEVQRIALERSSSAREAILLIVSL